MPVLTGIFREFWLKYCRLPANSSTVGNVAALQLSGLMLGLGYRPCGIFKVASV